MGYRGQMQVSVLGTVGIRVGGDDVDIGRRLQRLLAALACVDGDVVSVGRLVEIVWEGDPPAGAERTLRSYVTRLRRLFDHDRRDAIVFRNPGYALELHDGELDSAEFEVELDQGVQLLRLSDAPAAVPVLERAVGRWRGAAYGGFAAEEWARGEAVRLEERLLDARERLVEALVGAGQADRAVADAQALVEAEPLRERSRMVLMSALYAAGRQAEALRVFGVYRRYLADETGLDPSEELVEFEGRLARGEHQAGGAVRATHGYEIAERIGEGAFSVVHRAVQPGVERDVAIKVIRAELADRPDFIRRFEHEARTVARLEHPNVVPLIDFWREPGGAYLVMRWFREGSVERALRQRGPYSREQAIRLLTDVGAALSVAHRAGIVHRDVRPANLLLDEHGTTYLADFGIAIPAATADDTPIVSPAYAAPEVLRGEATGPAADVLSLGVTVFEVLTGRLPFGDTHDRAELIRRQLSEPLPPIRATRTDLPAAVDEVLARATAKAAADRHASVDELVSELASALSTDRVVAAGPRTLPESAAAPNPYLGLHAFDEQDADRYFGRETLVAEVLDLLERRPFVAVVGPSGSGKSSAVRAGVLPALRRGGVPGSDEWFITTMMPGSDPIDALEVALLRVAANPPASLRSQLAEDGGLLRSVRRVLPHERARILVVIDQFEELFTQVGDPNERDRFLSELAAAIEHPDSPLRVVATLRADHYDAPLRHPAMAELVTAGTIAVRPMAPAELERAIALPAQAVGVEVEASLLADLVAGVDRQPSSLPLLQFALTELFDRRVAGVMLSSVHGEIGGFAGALAARADRLVAAEDEPAVRRLFGRLVTLGDGVEDTRRRATVSELSEDERTAWLVEAFVAARLLATDRDPATREPTVEVAHEALLREWPRLRGWLADDRADLRTLHTVHTAASRWVDSGRDHGDLARGARLEIVEALTTRHPDWLTSTEAEWVTASVDARETEARAAVAAAVRDRRQNRRLRASLAVAAVLLVVAVVAAVSSVVQRNRAIDSELAATEARDDAVASEAAAESARDDALASEADANEARDRALASEQEAEAARDDAVVDRLVAQSQASLDTDPELAILLALEANRQRDDVDTQTAVHRSVAAEPRRVALHPTRGDDLSNLLFSADASVGFAWSGAGGAEWFDMATGDLIVSHSVVDDAGERVAVYDAGLSADGSVAVFARADQRLEIVDHVAQTVRSLAAATYSDISARLVFDAGGDRVAMAEGSQSVLVADVATGERLATISLDGWFGVDHSLAPDGAQLSVVWVGGGPPQQQVYDASTGEPVGEPQVLEGAGDVTEVARSVAGDVAVGFADGRIRLERSGGETVEFWAHSSAVWALATTGDTVLSVGVDDAARFWRADGSILVPFVPMPGTVRNAALSPDGRAAIAFDGGASMLLDISGSLLIEERRDRWAASLSPASDFYATPTESGAIEVRALADDELVRQIDVPSILGAGYGGIIRSSDGRWAFVYTDEFQREALLVDLVDDRHHVVDVTAFTEALLGREATSDDLANPRVLADGERLFLAVDSQSQIAGIFDSRTGELLAGPIESPSVGPALVLDDGRIVIGGKSGTGISVLPPDLDGDPIVVDDTVGMEPQAHDPSTGLVLLGGGDGRVALLDPVTGELTSWEGVTGYVYGGAFSPDGTLAAISTISDGVQLFDVASGRRLGIPAGYQDVGGAAAVAGVRWNEDGTGVWAAPQDELVLLAADPQRWREIACSVVHRELTLDEWRRFVSPVSEPVPSCQEE